jgi:hypothetical protein
MGISGATKEDDSHKHNNSCHSAVRAKIAIFAGHTIEREARMTFSQKLRPSNDALRTVLVKHELPVQYGSNDLLLTKNMTDDHYRLVDRRAMEVEQQQTRKEYYSIKVLVIIP